MHVHVVSAEGEAKFWIEPNVVLADYFGYNQRTLRELRLIVEEHGDEIKKAWKKHFKK